MIVANDRLKGRKTLKVAGFLDEFEKDDIKRKVDIVNLFEHFAVKLTKKGKSYLGKCPWHKDTNPSLSVDKDKGLYNCFGCGESGDAVTLTQKMKGVDFKEAVVYLKNTVIPAEAERSAGILSENTNAKSTVAYKKADKASVASKTPESVRDNREAVTLQTIAEYYHKRLIENKEALNYLKTRGIESPKLVTRFMIGFCDNSIIEKVSESQKEALKNKGIINKWHKEHFNQCVTVPVFDENNQAVGMYGRSIKADTEKPHLYLKGKHRSVFNKKASKVYDSIILTESIIDALSLIALGVENVQAIYGTNGFTDEHLKILTDDRVKEIIIAFDNDKPGKEATEKLRERLVAEGFAVKIITPAVGENGTTTPVKDWNEYLMAKGTKEAVTNLVDQAEAMSPEAKSFTASKDKAGHVFTTDQVTYRVSGVKDLFVSNLRVTVRAELREHEGLKYYDNLDLYSARSRNSFSLNLSKEFGLEQKRAEKDLIAILEHLEAERDRDLLSDRDKETEITLTAEEKELGMSLLTNHDMYNEILNDMTTLGYVGEEENKLLVWLAGVSRLLSRPLSVFIQSPPSTGKSYLLETLLKLLPEERAEWITSVSDQSFNYMDEEDFLDNIFMLGEALHNETIEGYIRQMQSENKIARKVVVKDPQSGVMKTMTVKHDVRLVFMQTSTAMNVNIENLSRCLVLKVDNSREQTERVLAMQRYKSSYKGYLEEKYVIPQIMKKHHAAQRLLQNIPVFNPFEGCISFPSTRPIMRRGQTQFLSLINASCIARQFHKEPVMMNDYYTGSQEPVYECDLEDYGTARRLFIEGKLLQYDEDVPAAAVRLYESIRKMVRKKAQKEGLSSIEVTFIQKDVREISELGNESIKRYLRILVSYEFLQAVTGKRHGTRYSYKLREDAPIDEIDIASIIPTVEEIKEMMQEAKNKKNN